MQGGMPQLIAFEQQRLQNEQRQPQFNEQSRLDQEKRAHANLINTYKIQQQQQLSMIMNAQASGGRGSLNFPNMLAQGFVAPDMLPMAKMDNNFGGNKAAANANMLAQNIQMQKQNSILQQQQQQQIFDASKMLKAGQLQNFGNQTAYGGKPQTPLSKGQTSPKLSGAPSPLSRSPLPFSQKALSKPKKPQAPVYDPMACSRSIIGYGGFDVDRLVGLLPKPKRVAKSYLGPIDTRKLALSLRSGLETEIAYALNVLSVLSEDPAIPLRLPDVPDLGDSLISLMIDSLGKLGKDVVPLPDLKRQQEEDAAVPVPLKSCHDSWNRSRSLDERCLTLSIIFRNLSISPETQLWLGRNPRFLSALLGSILASTQSVKAEKGAADVSEAVFLKEDQGEIALDQEKSETEMEADESPSRAAYVLLFRRNFLVTLLNISSNLEFSSSSEVQPILDALIDLLGLVESPLEAEDISGSTIKGYQSHHSFSQPPPAGVGFGVGMILPALESVARIAMMLRNSEILSSCNGLDTLVLRCLRCLPSTGVCDPKLSTQEDVLRWEFALVALSSVAGMSEATGALVARTGGLIPTMLKMSSRPWASPNSAPVTLNLQSSKKNSIMADHEVMTQRADYLSLRAMLVVKAACTSSSYARQHIRVWEDRLIVLATRQNAEYRRIPDVEVIASECLFLLADDD
ncbi:hypothetical protein BC829DRAFT_185874 [Chytridium lagenaria]|nr:hypothetical protein BC829DRAFT_185874 [Chytridium lagenaria]